MKILFVDDESKKLKRLYSAISQIEGINSEDLENVLDLKSAKEKLVSSFYDLVVMDLLQKKSDCSEKAANTEFLILTPAQNTLCRSIGLPEKTIQMPFSVQYVSLTMLCKSKL